MCYKFICAFLAHVVQNVFFKVCTGISFVMSWSLNKSLVHFKHCTIYTFMLFPLKNELFLKYLNKRMETFFFA